MSKSVLVLFGSVLPPREDFAAHDVVIAPEALRDTLLAQCKRFECLEGLVNSGSVQEAARLVHELSFVKAGDGRRVAKSVLFEGFELWWMHYDDLYYKAVLPYTQYRPLLERLSGFEQVVLHRPPHANIFRYYLEAHGRSCVVQGDQTTDRPSFSLILQALLSVPFLLWLMIRRPKLMVWTSDMFDPPRDHDFRYRYVYEELHKKGIPFVELIRSQERWKVMLKHALVRRRAVIYSFAITTVVRYLSGLSGSGTQLVGRLKGEAKRSPEELFWFFIATHYFRTAEGDMRGVRILRVIQRLVGIRAAIIPAGMSRTFHEVLACKLSDIPVIGILHGAGIKEYNVYDFMPGFDGEKSFGLDFYGMWSPWWKDYYERHSKVYRPEQLVVSGLMRPLTAKSAPLSSSGQVKALFISEQLGSPAETVPYLESLLETDGIEVYIKFRAYRDGFEDWLTSNRPDLLLRIGKEYMLRGAMNDAIEMCDVAIGSHTTGMLEALLQGKPFAAFYTPKWGDCFELGGFESDHAFLARTPEELSRLVLACRSASPSVLQRLRERFFGDPYQNGSAWVVDQVEEILTRRA